MRLKVHKSEKIFWAPILSLVLFFINIEILLKDVLTKPVLRKIQLFCSHQSPENLPEFESGSNKKA
jgi:hypothetical protein